MGEEGSAKAAVRNGCPAERVVTVQGIEDKELSGMILLWDNTAVLNMLRLAKS